MTWLAHTVFRFLTWCIKGREPAKIIGGASDPYLKRWHILPRNRIFNIYLHQFYRSDDDRALHDHPWMFNASWLLDGRYWEHTIAAGGIASKRRRVAGDCKVRWWGAPHRIELCSDVVRTPVQGVASESVRPDLVRTPQQCWTLFITGPLVRQWGFHCPKGWVHWKDFTADGGTTIGRGCDQ